MTDTGREIAYDPPTKPGVSNLLTIYAALLDRTEHRVLTAARAVEEGADEVLCVTPEGLACEGTRSNIFLIAGRRLITPGADGPLLAGILRRVVLDRAARLGLEAVEGPVSMESLGAAGEAFLTNSVRGMLPIARLLGVDLPAPGPLTQQLWSDILPWLESGGTAP